MYKRIPDCVEGYKKFKEAQKQHQPSSSQPPHIEIAEGMSPMPMSDVEAANEHEADVADEADDQVAQGQKESEVKLVMSLLMRDGFRQTGRQSPGPSSSTTMHSSSTTRCFLMVCGLCMKTIATGM